VFAKPERPDESQVAQLTTLLRQMQQGDHDAGEKAVGLVYQELHRIASRQLRREGPGRTLVTTALINEAYVRLSGGGSFAVESRGHSLPLQASRCAASWSITLVPGTRKGAAEVLSR